MESSTSTDFFERYSGEEDQYGFSLESCKTSEKYFRFLYQKWFQVTIVGLENIPSEGRAVLCGNHSGVLPLDGCMLYDGIIQFHPQPRRVRFLVNEFIRSMPVIGDTIRGFGGVPAKYDVAIELLKKEELVLFYPEAEKGTGKLFKDRYELIDFNPGFIKAAIETGSKIVPITTVGGDEIYPLLGNLKPVAKIMGAPYWPITPFYPWLPFPFNAIPLPIKLLICIGKPIDLGYPAEQAENRPLLESEAAKIQQDIQAQLNDLLAIRKSPFTKWDAEDVKDFLEHRR
ncbi:MAG: lysophospholipid acyltransferase family protein [Candidatus Melainabacteria bacterium]|nr:lysophospholipid acyltransferase family protein [Candidatus Melainabacteria bacterium]